MSITSYDLLVRAGAVTLDRQELWQHSLRVACCSRLLARRYHSGVPGEVVFVAGLLHEVGYTLLDQHEHGLFTQLVDAARRTHEDIARVEVRVTGRSHAEVGQWAAEAWNLPSVLQSAIRYHHDPFSAPVEHIVPAAIVAMADLLHHQGCWWEPSTTPDSARLYDYLELNAGEAAQLLHQVAHEVSLINAYIPLRETEQLPLTSEGPEAQPPKVAQQQAPTTDSTPQQRIRS